MKIHSVTITSIPSSILESRSFLCSAHTAWTVGHIIANPFQKINIESQKTVKICEKCKWDYELQQRA